MKLKRSFALLVATLLLAASALAAEPASPKHRVVFEFVGEGPEASEAVLNNVENLRKALGPDATQVRVVAHGKGLGILLRDNPAAARLEKIAAEGVVFAACENTMRKKQVTKEQLLPAATTVDSGVAEVVRKQGAGWSYIKSGG